ncbi:MAG TPA: CPBP family intramembrane glutamic endopeptidase [Candidatus Krumholzibacteria bacterium]|nr:CPBP family intramembrane glutamic endopeptidase [Candidatus Krumholzibacteria bacterium]
MPTSTSRTPFHLTTAGVVIISLALMVVAGLENGPAPWSPYYVVYAGLATILPLRWKTCRFGPVRDVPWWMWAMAPVVAILLQAFASVIVNVVYAQIVVKLGGPGRLDDPVVGVPAMFQAMYAAASMKLGLDVGLVRVTYLGFLILWAGFGEEVFFRGYVQGVLRERKGARYAILVAAVLFAVRHYMQMGLLFPKYPVFAATAWVSMALPLGIVLGIIYEKTKSLWIPVAVHYLFNIIPFLLR